MCGIVGVFGHPEAKKKVQQAIAILKNRGKDGSKFLSINPTSVFGHTLHAVVNNVPQPIQGKGILVANCEIYNWRELQKKYKLKAKNDAEVLLHLLDRFGIKKLEQSGQANKLKLSKPLKLSDQVEQSTLSTLSEVLKQLDGVYAFAYYQNNCLILARDILGEKPLWFAHEEGSFAFASEKKALEKLNYTYIRELHPRQILVYDINQKAVRFIQQTFFSSQPEQHDDYSAICKKTARLLAQAINKRIPSKKLGLLFSGGLDSTYLAHYLKQKKIPFTCYTAVLDTKETQPTDLIYAEKAARSMGLKLKVKKIPLSRIPSYLKKVVPLIEDNNVTKAGVALTFYAACELASKDGCKVIFSGLGSEEIFAGYERHKLSLDLNLECVSGLRKLYERDLYRDDVVTMHHGLELRLPYLDLDLVNYALKIPAKYKIKEGHSKYILRFLAEKQGVSHELAFRKKVAAQYGSRIDSAFEKLTKKNNLSIKSAYIYQFYPRQNLRLGVLFSSGKDSTYAAYIMQRQNYQLSCLITLRSKNKDSYMFQTAGIEVVDLQAQAMNLPLITQTTPGEKEKELQDLKRALQTAQEEYHIDGIITGALASTYQRERIENICEELGLKTFSPLWHKLQEQEMSELLGQGFKFILTAIAADGLDKSWLNRIMTKEDVEKLKAMNQKNGLNVAGEGGEFESLVLDCPLFKKRVVIKEFEIKEDGKNTARLIIKKAYLEEK